VVIVATRESIRSIPQMVREGSYACGATTWQTVRTTSFLFQRRHPHRRDHRHGARHRETAPIITIGALTFIAFLPSAHLPAIRPPGCSTGCSPPSP